MPYILQDSKRKGKRFVIIMPEYNHKHHFGSDVGETYIDHNDDKKKRDWIARHKGDKGWDSPHSGIFHARHLLWNAKTLTESIKKYKKKIGVNIINQTKTK